MLIEENDYGGAADRFRRAREIDRSRLERWPGNPGGLGDYADSLANLSRISFHERNAEECLRLGRESIEFRRKAVVALPGSEWLKKDLGHGLSNYCSDLVEFGRYQETLKACGESTRLLSEAAAASELRRVALRTIANNAEHVGRALAGLGRNQEAIASFEDSVRRLRVLEEELPLDASIHMHLARCLSLVAEARFKAGRPSEARAAGDEAVRVAEESVASDAANAKGRIVLNEIRARVKAVSQGTHLN